MAPTLVTAYTVNSNGSNNNTLTTPSFTPAANEFIVVQVSTDDSSTTVSGVSASANSPTFTSRYSSTTSSNCAVYLWTTRITPVIPLPMTISATASGSTGYRQMVVSRWTNATVNPSPAIGNSSSDADASATITTVGTNSVVMWLSADWNGATGDPTYRSSAAALGSVYTVSSTFVSYTGYQTAASPGSQTFGLSAPTGQKANMVAIELVTWVPAQATFAGAGTLNPNPTAQAALTGTGSLKIINAAPPVVTLGRGKLTVAASVIRAAAATLAGGGGLSLGGVHEHSTVVTLAGAGLLIAGGTRVVPAQVALAGAGALAIAGGLDLLTGPVSTAENVVGYFALRDLAVITGDATYDTAAQAIKQSLLQDHWVERTRRFGRGLGDSAESLLATALGGLLLTAAGEHTRARDQVRHLRRYRVKDRAIGGFHLDGPTGLQGYRPYGEFESSSFATPPAVIDQAGTWMALLFASRFGEPIGEDVRSLQRWRFNEDDSSYLYGAQWMRYSADTTGTTPVLRTRPYLGSAAWAYLLSQGAPGVLTADPAALPGVLTASLVSSYDYAAQRLKLTASWTRNSAPAAAYELVLELSTNSGSTWSQAVPTQRDSIERARVGSGYRYIWKLRMPANTATRYRIRVRLRNARFGSWVTSSSALVPSI